MDQFKTTDDLREYIKSPGKFCARPTPQGEHPTLYLDHSQGTVIHGIREKDYLFSFTSGFCLTIKWGYPFQRIGHI